VLIDAAILCKRYDERDHGMIFVFVLSALLGAAVTAGALWPLGVAVALIGAPFGGSLFALLVAVLLASRASESKRANSQHA
jgi:hypothetical protein